MVIQLIPRPWLDLYGVHIRVRAPKRDVIQVELAPIQQALPDEVLVLVLSKLQPYVLGKAACVCSQFRAAADAPRLWEAACQEAFHHSIKDAAEMRLIVRASYRSSWRRMFLEHPHLRFDGLYVSRNTYVKTGVVEWATRNAVHLVTYYRYYRFFSDGTLLYRTTPLPVGKAARTMRSRPKPGSETKRQWEEQHPVYGGRYAIKGSKVYCVVVYDNCRTTEIRSVLSLRSTRAGANDRLDIDRIFSFDRDLGSATTIAAGSGGSEADPEGAPMHVAGASQEHKRGMACCVHVAWENTATTPLNLSAYQMDYYMPG